MSPNPAVSPFEATLNDPRSPIAIHREPGSRTAVIACGGLVGAIGFPPFEFFNLTQGLPVTRIFLRDIHQLWYQRGLPGVAPDIDGIAAFLRGILREVGAERVVVVGNSMGGYAAIVMGLLLDADLVHAFVPQTFMDPRRLRLHRDRRFARHVHRVRAVRGRRYLDLRRLIHRRPPGRCRINVYYCPDHDEDRAHAERLRGLGPVRLHRFPGGGHELIRHLRDDGTLKRILLESL